MIKNELQQFEEKYEEEVSHVVEKGGALLRSKYGLWFLGVISFADSALSLPIVTDPFLAAYVVADKKRAVTACIVTAVTSVLGGVVAYIVALYFFELLLTLLSPEANATFAEAAEMLDQGTFIVAFFGALTPLPYSFIAIALGALKHSFLLFLLGSLVGRFVRFGIVTYVSYHYGEKALDLAKKNILLTSLVAVILAALYFVIL